MKKLLFTALILVVQLSHAMDIAVQPQKLWRQKFNDLNKEVYDVRAGYKLDLQLREDNRNNVIHTRPSIHAHGVFASSETMIEYLRVNGEYRIPGDVLTFDFVDAFKNDLRFMAQSNFGQTKDIKSLLVAMRCAHDSGFPGCNLFGQSRGAATIVNALSLLNTDVNDWDTEIKNCFDNESRKKILAMIKKGVVVLDTPLLDVRTAVRTIVKNAVPKTFYKTWAFGKMCDAIHDHILPKFTNYSPKGMQALTSVVNLPKEGLKFLVGYQREDEIVGDEHNKTFIESLIERLGKNNVWVVLGSAGNEKFNDETLQMLQRADREGKIHRRFGVELSSYFMLKHNAGFFTLLQSGILNEFFRLNDGSYN
jgi:hypothetical protein